MGMMEVLRQLKGQFQKYTFTVAVKNILYHFFTRERKRSYGPANPDKTIYIIRSINDKSPFYIGPVHNLLANYFYVLSHIQYAKTKGWIPVVDQLNYPVYNSQEEPINGTRNAWEYFWEQPGGISLEEAYRSKHVVLSKQSWFWQWDMGYDANKYRSKQTINQFNELMAMAPVNTYVSAYVEGAKQAVFSEKSKVLGVNLRMGGYARNAAIHGNGHPIQPEIKELLQAVKAKMVQWEMDYIYIASDTEFAIDIFRREFRETLIIYERERTELGKEYACDIEKQMYAPEKSYQTALDYLTEMELLASCDAVIGSITSGLRYALVKNNTKFRHAQILECGFFEDNNTFS